MGMDSSDCNASRLLIHLLHQILDFLDGILDLGHFLGELFVLATGFIALFFQGQGVVRPAFLVVGFESRPFLAEALLCQPLDLGNLIDTPLDFLMISSSVC
jgi:hypothetical protein